MINFIHGGGGSPVILIHGLAASLFDWNDLLPTLTESGFSFYAMDLPGHGMSKSEVPEKDYDINYVFSAFCEWLDNLSLNGPVTLIGHSLGAYIAVKYAALHPTKITCLILCDPFYSQSQLPYFLRVNYKYSIINTNTIEIFPQWFIRLLIDITSFSIRNGYYLPKNIRDQTALDYKRANPGIFNIVPSIIDISEIFNSIIQPTLIIWGTNDKTLNTDSFKLLVNKIPNSVGYAIQNAGHVPHQSHSKEFNKVVLKFLTDLQNPEVAENAVGR